MISQIDYLTILQIYNQYGQRTGMSCRFATQSLTRKEVDWIQLRLQALGIDSVLKRFKATKTYQLILDRSNTVKLHKFLEEESKATQTPIDPEKRIPKAKPGKSKNSLHSKRK